VLGAAGGGDVFNVVVHIATPAGNNSAGVLWTDAVKNSGRNTSVLSVGNGAGQITQAEMNTLTAGTIVEGVMQWQDDPSLSNAQRIAALDAAANQLGTELLARYSQELKYFGFVRG
jgi:hypothetical protein